MSHVPWILTGLPWLGLRGTIPLLGNSDCPVLCPLGWWGGLSNDGGKQGFGGPNLKHYGRANLSSGFLKISAKDITVQLLPLLDSASSPSFLSTDAVLRSIPPNSPVCSSSSWLPRKPNLQHQLSWKTGPLYNFSESLSVWCCGLAFECLEKLRIHVSLVSPNDEDLVSWLRERL